MNPALIKPAILVIILSMKGQFHHDIDVKVIPDLTNETCPIVSNLIKEDLSKINNDMSVTTYCK